MDEQLLQYIWKFQKFNTSALKTTDGKSITVFETGHHNHDSGPDFEEARVKVGDIEWAGHVEIHIQSSDWNKHRHQVNPAYNNVILHVVWKDDRSIYLDKSPIPTLELEAIVDPLLLKTYKKLISNESDILCENQLTRIPSLTFDNMMDKASAERMNLKAKEVHQLMRKTKNSWEEVTHFLLVKNFGFSINKRSFSTLATSLSHKTLTKYRSTPLSIEALLFGQAGFLDSCVDQYQRELKAEFQYLKRKHNLEQKLTKSSWKFGKMRPSNFPTVRLAQLASLLSHKPKLFSMLIQETDPKRIIDSFKLEVTDYWKEYYDFGKKSKTKSKGLGKTSIENIIINTICPLLFAYASYTDSAQYRDKAIALLEAIQPEKNRVTKKWETLGKYPSNAYESQGLMLLYKEYCDKRRCLECNVGFEIMRK